MKKTSLLDSLFLALLSIAVFYGSLDIYFVSENISHIENASKNFLDLTFTNFYFRPVYALSLFLDNMVWGANHSGYHLTNLLLHSLNTLLVYYLGQQILKNRFAALTAAFLFLLHPIHSLSLFWISGRTDMICSLFYLSALNFFVKYFEGGNKKYRVFALLAFLLSIFAKEMAVSLPLVLILYVLIFDESNMKQRWLKAIRLSAPYFLIVFLYTLVRFVFIPEAMFSSKDHGDVTILQLLKNVSAYLGLLLIPGGHIEIAKFLKSNPIVFVLLSIGSLVIFIVSIKWIRKSQHLLFFVAFTVLALLPVLRLMMRWYLYIPSVGFCLAAAYLLYRLHDFKIGKFKLSYPVAALIFFVYAFFIMQEQSRWINAGRVSKDITSKISQTIVDFNLEKCLFLNLPAELEEVPVLLYGLESFINFRLSHDFQYSRKVRISPVSYISLRKKEDLDKLILGKTGEGEYVVSLKATDSFFIFPRHSEIASKRAKIEAGQVLESPEFIQKIENLNEGSEADKLSVEITDPQIPLLYYLNGTIYLDDEPHTNSRK